MAMPPSIVGLEELSFRTLPALVEERYDGWVLRWSDGGSRRGNSINPIASSSRTLEDKIDYCERWFAERNLPAIFRLTPLADAGLDEALAARGYSITAPTDVMAADMARLVARVHPDVELADGPPTGWLTTVPTVGDGDDSPERLGGQLTGGVGRPRFARIATAGTTLAIGLGIELDGMLTIYNMNTTPTAQRRGHATRILETLLATAAANGCTGAVLQVTQANTAAQALYRGAGFVPTYTYKYREPSG